MHGLVLPHLDCGHHLGRSAWFKAEMQQRQAFQNRFAKKIAGSKHSSAEALVCELRIVPCNITLIAGVSQCPKNFHFRRDVNEHFCGVERSDKMTSTYIKFLFVQEFSKCRAGSASNLKCTFQARLSTTASIPFLHDLPRDWGNKIYRHAAWHMLRDCVRPLRHPCSSKNLENHEKTLTSSSCCGKYIKTFKRQGNKL